MPGTLGRVHDSIPAATLSSEPCISTRTSYPRPLYRLLETTEGAVLENQQRGRRINVAMLAKVRRTLIRASGVDLHDLLTTDPSDHVEVIDRAVSEDLAG